MLCDTKPPGVKYTARHRAPQQSLSGTWSHPLISAPPATKLTAGPGHSHPVKPSPPPPMNLASWATSLEPGLSFMAINDFQLAFQTRQEVYHCVSHQGDICKKLLRSLQHAGLHKFTFIEGFWRERSVASNKVTDFYRINRFDIPALSEHRLLFPSIRQQFSHLLWFCCPSVLLYAPAWSAHSGDAGWILPAVKCAANTPDTQPFPWFPWIEEQTFFLVMMVAKRRPSSISTGTA